LFTTPAFCEPNILPSAFNTKNRNGRCIMDSRYQVRKTAGFTLIELLIALAILAIVAAILFPVFAGVRERGRRTTCQSNLKQLAIAMQEYVQDNGGIYPPSVDWGYAPYSYLKNISVFRCPDAEAGTATGGQFSLDPPIFSANRMVIWEDAVAPTDYTYNALKLHYFTPTYTVGTAESSLATPSTTGLNEDASWSDNDGDHYFRTVRTSCGRDFPGNTLHSGAGNYSYIDGHVKWLTPEEAGEIECANGPLPAPFKD